MNNRSVVLLSIILSLTIGAFIYGVTRTESIYLNQWLGIAASGKVIDFFQGLIPNSQIPHWFIYSLPDGLWMIALILLLLYIWDHKLDLRSIPWIAIALIFGISLEVSQGFHFVRGTFDIVDLWFIGAGGIIPVFIVIIKKCQHNKTLKPNLH